MPTTQKPPPIIPKLTAAQREALERIVFNDASGNRSTIGRYRWSDVREKTYSKLVDLGLAVSVDHRRFLSSAVLTEAGTEVATYLFKQSYGVTPTERHKALQKAEREHRKRVAEERKEIRALLRSSELPPELKQKLREAVASNGDRDGQYDRLTLYREDILTLLRAVAETP